MSVKKNNSDIRRAVEELPGLIYDEVHKKGQPKKTPVYVPPHNSKVWLIVGVIIFSLCILALWGVNVASVMYETKNSDDATLHLIEDSQTELQNVFDTFGEQEQAALTELSATTSTDDAIAVETDASSTIKNILTSLFDQGSTTSTPQN